MSTVVLVKEVETLEVVASTPGPTGPGVPVGGSTGQVLAKIDGTNYNTQWVNQSGGLGTISGASDSQVVSPLVNEVLAWNGVAWQNSSHASVFASAVHSHDGASITSGTVAPARLGTGSSITTKFLRGDSSWQTITPGATDLDGLSDVTLSSPLEAQVLRFNGTTWVNSLLAFADLSSTPTTLAGYGITDAVPSSRTITAGTGLTGGGDLSANRTLSVSFGTSGTTACVGDDSRLSDARTPTAHTHAASDVASGTLGIDRNTASVKKRTVIAVFNGGNTTPSLGSVEVAVPFAGVISKATILGDVSGSAVVDVHSSTYTGYPTMNSIAASAKPTLSASAKNQDSTLTGWTTSVAANSVLRFVLESVTTCKRVTVVLEIDLTA